MRRFSWNLIPYFFRKLGKMPKNLSSAAVVIVALWFKHWKGSLYWYQVNMFTKFFVSANGADHDEMPNAGKIKSRLSHLEQSDLGPHSLL